MGILGGLIGGGIGAVGSIFGGISASKTMKKVKQNLQNQLEENQNRYDRRYNEDSTQRADAQRLLTNMEESIKRRTKAAEGAAAVAGGTTESVAAAKAQANEALADVTSQIAADAANRKDSIERQYLSNKADINQQLNELEMQKAQNTAQAIQGAAQAGADIAGIL